MLNFHGVCEREREEWVCGTLVDPLGPCHSANL